MKQNKCDLCEKNAMEEMLIKYPFVISYKNVETTEENVDKDSYRCLKCLVNDYKEKA